MKAAVNSSIVAADWLERSSAPAFMASYWARCVSHAAYVNASGHGNSVGLQGGENSVDLRDQRHSTCYRTVRHSSATPAVSQVERQRRTFRVRPVGFSSDAPSARVAGSSFPDAEALVPLDSRRDPATTSATLRPRPRARESAPLRSAPSPWYETAEVRRQRSRVDERRGLLQAATYRVV